MPPSFNGEKMSKLGDKRKEERRVTPGNWDVYVATPAYDGKVDCDYSQSLAESAFCSPLYQVKLTAGVMGNGAFIDLARNIFVKIFLEDFPDATHLFFIDADLKFPPNAFIGLIRSGHPICAGVYRRRQEPEDYPVRWVENPETGGLWIEDDWLMCDRVPTGFLCISREVIEEMAKDATQLNLHGQDGPVPQLFYTKVDEQGRFVGEDYCFCDDYMKKYNKPIPVWPDIDFVHGGYKGNLAEYLQKRVAEAESQQTSAA
jgi:hypothetical protein